MIKFKILLSLLTIGCLVSNSAPEADLSIKKVSNGSHVAGLKGFEIPSEFSYVVDYEPSQYKDIYSGTRFYGIMDMWTAIYSFHDIGHDTMYYACLTQTAIQPTDATSWDIRGMFNEYMDIKVSLDGSGTLISHIPLASEISTTTTHSLSLSIQTGVDSQGNLVLGHNFQLGWSEQSLTPSITVTNKVQGNAKNNIATRYNFTSYKKNNKLDASYSFVQKNTMSIFGIPNYNFIKSSNQHVNVQFEYTASIYRNGKINSSSKTENEFYTYQIL